MLNNSKKAIKTKEGEISEAEALIIQKDYLASVAKKAKQKLFCTPPYLVLCNQVFDENIQISKAAVFNLAEIARQTQEHEKNILAELKKIAKTKGLDKDLKLYILDKIEYIKGN